MTLFCCQTTTSLGSNNSAVEPKFGSSFSGYFALSGGRFRPALLIVSHNFDGSISTAKQQHNVALGVSRFVLLLLIVSHNHQRQTTPSTTNHTIDNQPRHRQQTTEDDIPPALSIVPHNLCGSFSDCYFALGCSRYLLLPFIVS